ncbi:MAG: hypothetical protein LWW77_00555 [Propionibacteriales bacterium]|jgi:hypothetical protein|nr:hypothetical protein [Propionibacteriales bacterium]
MNTMLARVVDAAHLAPALIPLKICPKAPPGAQQYADDITGYVLWGVIILFSVGVIVAIGGIVAGRIFNMPHASKAGIVGIFVVLLAAIAFVVAPGIVDSILGKGCI